jgi:hypothetical protein
VSATLFILVACLIAIGVLGYAINVGIELLGSDSEVGGCVFVVLAVPLSLYLAVRLLKLQAALSLRFAASYVHTWRDLQGTAPPWPFAWFDCPDPRQRDAFLLMMLLIPILLIHGFAVLFTFIVAIACMPFRFAEWLRKTLTPEKPHYLETLAYLLSVAVLALTLYKHC